MIQNTKKNSPIKIVENKILFRMVFRFISFALMVFELFTFKFDKILTIQILLITFILPYIQTIKKAKKNSQIKIVEHKTLFGLVCTFMYFALMVF